MGLLANIRSAPTPLSFVSACGPSDVEVWLRPRSCQNLVSWGCQLYLSPGYDDGDSTQGTS